MKDAVNWIIGFLEEIEISRDKMRWCQNYSVYSSDCTQRTLTQDINKLLDIAYEKIMVPDYSDTIKRNGLMERDIATADEIWIKNQTYSCILACITWYFRRDRFHEGSLIREGIASGALLRLFRQLRFLLDECPAVK